MKSQYTDSITGDILTDTRVYKDKLIDFATSFKRSYYGTNQDSTPVQFATGKFGTKSICFSSSNTNGSNVYFGKKIHKYSKFTLSYWGNTSVANNSSGAWHEFRGLYVDLMTATGPNHLVNFVSNTSSSSRVMRVSSQSNNNNWVINTSYTYTLNTWHHWGITYDGSQMKTYFDGILYNTVSFSNFFNYNTDTLQLAYGAYLATVNFDDMVLIADQILWTGNFNNNLPNYYLTGDHELNRISNKWIYFPKPINRGDYFDKAFIY